MNQIIPSKDAAKKGDAIFQSLSGLNIQDARAALEHASGRLGMYVSDQHKQIVIDLPSEGKS
jgi:hypothetical protein